MTHKELIEKLSHDSGATKAATEKLLSLLSGVAAEQLQSQGSFTLHGIGTLKVVNTAARQGRHPQTGETLNIPAGKRIKLSASKGLKAALA
ncbi:MAG: HU family DNA-binding protein [Methylicorpusculum sp.]|uniref:HU family DNA-binding protein n=1 Tax=Methylicorpusculum sp. TaxID=2713644 RepID=UPI00271C865B|nr:HU family DNA-binding protein [Methylicorpusculum sp.]MDO8940879.1 HU family DNA-binding protein [Methylicorpusculum sp.]